MPHAMLGVKDPTSIPAESPAEPASLPLPTLVQRPGSTDAAA